MGNTSTTSPTDFSTSHGSRLRADLDAKLQRARDVLRSLGRVAVAFSGGVDSTFVLKLAVDTLGRANVLAVTGVSGSLAEREFEDAQRLAESMEAEHVLLETHEFEDPQYLSNPTNRCYFCKTELYTQMTRLLAGRGSTAEGVRHGRSSSCTTDAKDVRALRRSSVARSRGPCHALGSGRSPGCATSPAGEAGGGTDWTIVSGTNADDLGDYRPGLTAASEHAVRAPLAEAGLTKADVRALSAEMGLPTHDKPASPCLSSRVQYGEAITPEKLRMIERGEAFLRELGIRECRVRHHDELARIEVPADQIAGLAAADVRAKIDAAFREIGYHYVTLDLRGFRSGSMNEVIAFGKPQ